MIKKKLMYIVLLFFLIVNKSFAAFDYSTLYISFKENHTVKDLPLAFNEYISTFSIIENLNLTKLKLQSSDESQGVFQSLSELPYITSITPEPLFTLNELPNDPLFDNPLFQSLIDSGHPFLNTYTNSWAPFIFPDSDNERIPSFNSEFGLEKPALYGLQMIGMERVWEDGFDSSFKGDGIKVAILDTGIDYFHSDLSQNSLSMNDSGNIIKQKDFICDQEPQDETCRQIDLIPDFVGHGTKIAGVIAAVAENNRGLAGVASLAKLLSIKIFDDVVRRPSTSLPALLNGFRFANSQGAKVVNLSFSLGTSSNDSVHTQIQNELTTLFNDNTFIVTSAGEPNNSDTSDLIPARYPETFVVSSIDHQFNLLDSANFGTNIDVVAPGKDIFTTFPSQSPSDYSFVSGTSISAAFVSGMAAVLLSKNEALNPYQLAHIIRNSARDVGAPGYDVHTGFGLIQVDAALDVLDDLSKPEIRRLDLKDTFITANSDLVFKWEAIDLESGIISTPNSLRYFIGTSQGASDSLSVQSITGNASHYLAATTGNVVHDDLALSVNRHYFLGLKVQNGLAMDADPAFTTLTVITPTPSMPIFNSVPEFITENAAVSVGWQFSDDELGIRHFQVAVGTGNSQLDELNNMLDWVIVPSNSRRVALDFDLDNGETYFFSIRAINELGTTSNIFTTNGIVTDFTTATSINVSIATTFFKESRPITVSWSAQDLESTISDNRYALFDETGTRLTDFIVSDNITAVDHTLSDISLTSLSDYDLVSLGLQFRNGVGEYSPVTLSSTLTFLPSNPQFPLFSQNEFFSSNNTELSVSWSVPIAFQPGITSYSISVGESQDNPDSIISETPISLVNTHTFSNTFDPDISYVVMLKSQDVFSDQSEPVFVTYNYDLTLPEIPVVVDDGNIAFSSTSLVFSWTSSDLESGLSKSRFQLLTALDAPLSDWTVTANPELSSANIEFSSLAEGQTYFLAVQVMNRAGIWSSTGFSDGITIDLNGPDIVMEAIEYVTSKNNLLNLSWSVEDLGSDPILTQIAVGDEETSSNINWRTIQNIESFNLGEIRLVDDRQYLFLRSQNQNGLFSDTFVRPIFLDREVPEIHTTSINGGLIDTLDTLYGFIRLDSDIQDNRGLQSLKVDLFRVNTSPNGIVSTQVSNMIDTLTLDLPNNGVLSASFSNDLRDNNRYFTVSTLTDLAGNQVVNTSNTFIFFHAQRVTMDDVISYPNPFNPLNESAKIQFFLSRDAEVSLYIHAMNGQLIHSDTRTFASGLCEFTWNGYDRSNRLLANGIYFAYVITQDPSSGDTLKKVVKIVVLK